MAVDGAPDLTDFMNDWFFGTVGARHAHNGGGGGGYDLTGESNKRPASPAGKTKQAKSGGGSSSASKQTQDWLEEAKRMVGAGSPGRGLSSPSRQVPRFAGGSGTTEPSPTLDRRDPMSRSARRNWQPGGIGDEILQRASISSPPRSSTSDPFASSAPPSPSPSLPPNPQSSRRKSRFRDAPTPESPHRRTTVSSASTSPTAAAHSRHRRHASASSAPAFAAAAEGFDDGVARLNTFLRRQRAVIDDDLAAGDRHASRPTKLVLSDASKSVSSIVAAICYAWMLSSKGDGQAAVPVVNMRRSRMARCRQAAWLLYHVGVDASALLFADEVDMDGLVMDQRVSLLVVGQDVLKSKSEVGSVCTTLTNTYCEDAYSLFQSLDIKKLLLAGILLDTSNLSKKCSNRDSEAVQLLLFGASEHMRHELFQQCNDESPPEQKRSTSASGSSQDAKKSNSTNQRTTRGSGGKAADEASRGKNNFFLAKWFGFGRK
nr:unnamed protein product [Digitaria exilis]